MADLIRLLLANFTLTLLALGLVVSGIALLRTPRPWAAATVVDALLALAHRHGRGNDRAR